MSAPSVTSPFVASPFVAVRAPTLPMRTVASLSDDLASPSSPDDALADALARDRTLVCDRLRAHLADPRVREALWLASPSLDAAVDAWLADPAHPRAHDVPSAALRYLTRMAARATPFGLFASHAVGAAGDATRVRAPSPGEARRHVRLDMQYLCALVARIERDPELRPRLRFETCNTAYASGAQLRYAEGRVDPVTRERRNDTVSVERTEALDATLSLARAGASLDALCASLVGSAGAPREEAEAFVDELVDAGLLVSELSPALTEGDALDALLARLDALAPEHGVTATLRDVRARLRALATATPEDALAGYARIADALATLPCPVERGRLFQVDLHGPRASVIGRDVLREVERVVSALAAITPCREDPALTRFRDRFVARWEDATVPLSTALDEERGLGFDDDALGGLHPLLDGVALRGAETEERVPSGARERWMMARVHDSIAAGRGAWRLDATDLERLRVEVTPPMPDAFAAVCTLLAPSAEDDPTVRFELASGPSGARLLGRFASGDEALEREVRAHLRAEEALRPDAIFAEVVHLPQGRLGNIAARPSLRAWEIPYLCRGAVDAAHQLPIEDLMVRVDGAGCVRLSSRRIGREVIPRMTNAHNHLAAELPIYRFLCALAGQGVRGGLMWSWGALAQAPFLPRVTLGRTVVSLALWNLDADALTALARRDSAERLRGLRALRSAAGMPRVVAVQDGDNALPLDLENPIAVESFFELVRGRTGRVAVREVLGETSRCVASSSLGGHAHEIVVPFARRETSAPAAPLTAKVSPRRFAPGSEWLYVKVYTGTLTADAALSRVVGPVVESQRAEGALARWFFVRYADPEPHLRLRFTGAPSALVGSLLPALHRALSPWLDDGRVARLTVDTYVPETARYGGEAALPLCEEIFEADSDATVAMLGALDGDAGADLRWRAALRSLHDLFDALGLDLDARASLLDAQRLAWSERLGATRETAAHLSRRFREERASLASLLGGDCGYALAAVLAPWRARAARLSAPSTALARLSSEGRLAVSLASLSASLAHMTVNRAMGAAQNAYEVVLYDLLARLYRADLARRGHRAVSP